MRSHTSDIVKDLKSGAIFGVAHCYDGDEESSANLCLIVAAVNSYGKHCGTRAIECAEGDLLGECLTVMEDAIRCIQSGGDYRVSVLKELRTALAKTGRNL